MEIIKLDRVVSVNSELQGHSAENLLDGEAIQNRSWMCEKGTDRAVVVLQLERTAILTSIQIGNSHSAFVEVFVGKADDGSDQFESLIPMSVFMNPTESKTGETPNRTRLFDKSNFDSTTAAKSWDRIKVVCTQPYNKNVPYGLSFLKVHGEKEQKKYEVLAKSEEKDEIEIGSFFKRKRSSAGDQTVGEQVKEAKKDEAVVKPSPAKIHERSSKKSEERSPKRKKEEERTPKRKKEEEKTPKRKEEERKRKNDIGDEKTPKRKKQKKKKKPFEKLMEDVVLVISGFKNPLRGDIRLMALEMGAKYSGDWEPHSTHLVCAYENTPKFHQVKGKGKIVRKDWVEKCHKDRKRYPWRRFALDQADLNKPESEEEIDAGEDSECEEQVAGGSGSAVMERSPGNIKTVAVGNMASATASPYSSAKGSRDYDVATDDEEEKTVDTTDYPMPFLPDIFSQKIFYIEPNLQTRSILERYIVAYNGEVTDTFHEDVDFYITDKGGAPVELFRKKASNLVAIKPSWIWEINSKQKYIPKTPHLVK